MRPAVPGVRAVLFDVDGTLYRQGPLRARMARELLAYALRSPADGVRTVRVLQRFRAEREHLRRLAMPDSSLERVQYEVVAEALGVAVAGVREVVAEWILRRPIAHVSRYRRPGIDAFLEACDARGVAVGALSDYPTREKVEALGVGRWFGLHLCTTDPEVNAFKPSPRGLLEACRRLGVVAGEVLYVGDRPDVDGASASAAGTGFALVGGGRSGNGPGAADFRTLIPLLG